MPRIKVSAAKLAVVLGNVLPHAGTDDTLPVLCAVQATLDADGLTLAATDRFSLGWETLAAATERVDGVEQPVLLEGGTVALIDAKDVKAIIVAAKKIKNPADLVEMDFADSGTTVTVRSWHNAGQIFRLVQGEYVHWRALIPTSNPVELSAFVLNPWNLAKLSDVADQARAGERKRRDERRSMPLRFSFYGSANKPVLVEAVEAPFRALLMPVRLS